MSSGTTTRSPTPTLFQSPSRRRRAYEVEFVTGGRTTLAVLTLEAATLRLLAPSDMLRVREVGRA